MNFCKNVKIGIENKKSFVEIKPVLVVKHVDLWLKRTKTNLVSI